MRKFSSFLLLVAILQLFSFESHASDTQISLERPYPLGQEIDLYFKVRCPYSQKVIRYLNQAGLAVTMKDIGRDEQVRDQLIELSGKAQVPCLLINGQPLLDSDAIIEFLDQHIAISLD